MLITARGHVVIGSVFGKLVMLQPDTGQVRVLHESSGKITGLSQGSSGNFLAADSRDWYGEYSDEGDLLEQGMLGKPGNMRLQWDAAGDRVASVDANGLISHRDWREGGVWNSLALASTGQRCVGFSANGRWLAGGGVDQQLRLWDLETGRFGGSFLGHPGRIQCVAWRGDGERLVTGDDRGFIRVWHPRFRGGQQSAKVQWSGVQIALQPDTGEVLTVGREGLIGRWNPTSWASLGHHDETLGEVIDLIYLPGRSRYAALTELGQLMVWEGRSGDLLLNDLPAKPFEGGAERHFQMAIDAPRNRLYVSRRGSGKGRDNGIEVWSLSDLTYQRTIALPGTKAGRLALAPSGHVLVVGDSAAGLLFLDLNTESTLSRLALSGEVAEVRQVQFSPDGNWILAHTWGQDIFLIHPGKRRVERVLRHGGDVLHCATFGAGGTRVFGGTRGGHVAVWDTSTGEHLTDIDLSDRWIISVAFDEQRSRLLVGTSGGLMTAYDLQDSRARMGQSFQTGPDTNLTGDAPSHGQLLRQSLEIGWRNLLSGDPDRIGKAHSLAFYMERQLPLNREVAGLLGAARLMRGDLEEAERRLGFALSEGGLRIQQRRELSTLHSIALGLTGQGRAAAHMALRGDVEFLVRWQLAVGQYRSH